MKNSVLKFRPERTLVFGVILFLCLFAVFFSDSVFASAGAKVTTYIEKTYDYDRGSAGKVLTDEEAKKALTRDIDLLILASGRDVGHTALTDGEFSLYLGYVNYHLRSGNGSYKAADFLRCALAVGAAGGDPSYVGKDVDGNRVNLLYKGVYSRSLTTLEKEGAKTVAYALLALDANEISDGEIYSSGSKVSREQLKNSLVTSAKRLASQGVPDVGTSAMVLSALSPYYINGDSSVVAAADALLHKIARLQGVDGSVKDNPSATAETLIALCVLGIDPTQNAYFDYDVYSGLQRYYCSNGGYSSTQGGSSSPDVTHVARCGLVAYRCFQENGFFYDFSGVKHHEVTAVASPKTQSTTTKKSNTSSVTKQKNSVSQNSSQKKNSGAKSSSSSSGASSKSAETKSVDSKIVKKSVFEGIKNSGESYVYEGTWGESEAYSLTFKGEDITTPMDFNPEISSVAVHQMEIDAAAADAEYIVFQHGGAFPGKAAAKITVSVPDGAYHCYRYDVAAGKFVKVSEATVTDGMVAFSLDVGGEYFITSAAVETKSHTFTAEDTVNGVVPASVFENIKGKDVDLTLEGATESGLGYEITFHGTDIVKPVDFNIGITEETANHEAIAKLTKEPLTFHFQQEGAIPGKATVTVAKALNPDVSYGLYYFNEELMEGEYCGAVSLKKDSFSFTIDHCSDYFITVDNGKEVLSPLPGMSPLTPIAMIGELLIVLIAIGAALYRCYGKDGLKAKIQGCVRGFSSLKAKKTTADTMENAMDLTADNDSRDRDKDF